MLSARWAVPTGGEVSADRLAEIGVPFLVVHGTATRSLPTPHGVALANAVPGATLVTIEGGGHELHEGDRGQLLDAILGHTQTGDSAGP